VKLAWCWRCKKNVPMIDEAEFQALFTAADDRAIFQECRALTGMRASIATRKMLLSHRAAKYGPPCVACGKPLRTPRASFCGECGKERN
jgi:hypothetical protein